ncbi:hypothetical protein D3C76_1271250 [compost metagenome]
MLGVQAFATVQVEVAGSLGQRQLDRRESLAHLFEPRSTHGGRVGGNIRFGQQHLVVASGRQFDGEAPQCRNGGEHALAAFFCTAPHALHPLAGTAQVVGDFLECLGGDTGDTLVAGPDQAL